MLFWWWSSWMRGNQYAREYAAWALQEAYAQRERADSYARACAEWAASVVAAGGTIPEAPPVLPGAPEIGAPAPAYGVSPDMTALERMRETNRRTRAALDAAWRDAARYLAAHHPPRPMTATEVLERTQGGGARRQYARETGDPGVASDYRPEWAVPLSPRREPR